MNVKHSYIFNLQQQFSKTLILQFYYSSEMAEKFNYQQWKRMSLNVHKTKQNMEELSKLYIISHEKVKLILRKCQTNLQYNPIKDSETQLLFIKNVLDRLANRQTDEYLLGIDNGFLDKYEKNFQDLIQLLRLALFTYNSQQQLNLEKLTRVKEDKATKNGQYSLQNQVKKSEGRMLRTKSGHRITKNVKIANNNQYQTHQHKQQLIPAVQTEQQIPSKVQINDPKTHTQQFLTRKSRLEQIINSQIDKQNFGLNFKKKYNKLDEYLQQRKQFADLIFSQKYYDKMIEIGQTRKNQPIIQEKMEPDLNKLFPEFNIKTKYMKKQVKQNILRVIFQVKKQLLKQYHQSNAMKMKQTTPLQKQKQTTKKMYNSSSRARSQSQLTNPTYNRNLEMRFQSTNRPISERRNSLGNLRVTKTGNGNMRKAVWKNYEWLKDDEAKVQQMLLGSKMPDYKK